MHHGEKARPCVVSPTVGPALRLALADQYHGQWLYVGMEGVKLPPPDDDLEEVEPGYVPQPTVEIFAIVRGKDGKTWLSTTREILGACATRMTASSS